MTPAERAREVVRQLQDQPLWLEDDFGDVLAKLVTAAIETALQESGIPPAKQEVAQVVGAWYRDLSRKYHPDRQGSHEAMTIVNDANERLRKVLGIQ